MYFFFFSFLVYSLTERYSLVPPFVLTNLSEINDWTIRGSVVNMKNYLRLTDAVTDGFGGICHRVPTRFLDWMVEIEISAKGGNSGEGFFFFFTKECCPDLFQNVFTGFEVWINTTQTNREDLSPIYFYNSANGEKFENNDIKSIGNIHLRRQQSPVRLRITKKENSISIEYSTDSSHKKIFSTTIEKSNLIEYGYFSLFAITSLHADNNDLFSFRTISLSEPLPGESNIDFSSLNRKMINDNVIARRAIKSRRRSKFIVSNKYAENIDENKGILTGKPQELRDAFKIIKETEIRGKETVSINELKKFIDEKIDSTIEKAMKKIDLASSRFDETKIDMNDVWSYLKTQLYDLSTETTNTLKQMGDEALQSAKEIKLANFDKKKLKLKMSQIKENDNTSNISKILFIICGIETFAYIAFFIIQRKRTHGFTKVD
ncbi:Legume-like lectin family protein [Tritrichomonas foetus]|uniref:Legume-like lectin family protein n=1 Tax=Tritrichomonas foetus TaxID=1144522 RepID=A0A1J4KMQ8_9EUKA|nr:Legume-like lectin family protein [Tritrichomonas foetus]|eukprot:OHT11084.1 Legume-like lectin family protein [Tritrichomonas foetus]